MNKLENNKAYIIELLEKAGSHKIIPFLHASDFFVAPASTFYHGVYPGALAQHSLNVWRLFKEKCENFKRDISEDSIVKIAILHDICKINRYHWITVEGKYIKEERGLAANLGHGAKSLYLISQHLELTSLEAACILYHMGPFHMRSEFETALKTYPEILLIYTADYEDSKFLT
jgi:23S rRNA maturation-related 3'-5' exoribonuclease YhaM